MKRVVIVTGGSDGIGAEIARQLAARDGAAIALVLAARNQGPLELVAGQCRALGAETLTVAFDAGRHDDCRRLVAQAVERFGRIDVLVNNAGRSAHALFEEVDDLAWYEELMRVNVWGSVWCTRAALPQLKASRGAIVAVSSLAGLVGVPGRTAYCATKFAMSGFFEALRAEMKDHGVSVTTAYPGVVATRIRYRGFNARGEEAGASALKEERAMPVEECARLIVRAMERREREVVMTTQGRLGRWLKLIAPGVVEKMALAAVKDDLRPQ
ncbi:SDR family oxidoreductase [Telluria beijingensis]|uniref:SDR family oxidoreductase n=1 Tax=Telluria beijingensis TaxID=3068633 RepID=UPI002795B57A|nr:SDR family oxidoreductase [Massilia sp. REN29]